MSKVRRARRPHKPAPKGELKKPRPVWFVTLMAFVLPGSGQWLNGAPIRGMIMQFSMLLGAYLTYQLTTPEISLVGRLAGGLLVWVFSIVDANGIAKRAGQGLGAHRGRTGRKDKPAARRRRRPASGGSGAPRRRAAEASGWRFPAAGDLRGLRHLNGADSHAGEGRPGPSARAAPRTPRRAALAARGGGGVGGVPLRKNSRTGRLQPDITDQGCR